VVNRAAADLGVVGRSLVLFRAATHEAIVPNDVAPIDRFSSPSPTRSSARVVE
jgi:hypothetical protein